MNIILGASGQVGGAVIDHLVQAGAPVRGIIRDAEKAHQFAEKGVTVGIADNFDEATLETAFTDGRSVFVITPETGQSNHIIEDTEIQLGNFRAAIEKAGIKKIVGLSSLGAQHKENSGNLKMSYLLEHAFNGMGLQKIFLRAAYYYSNWVPYIPAAKENGILPTFFPVDLKIPMSSPLDVAKFAGDLLLNDVEGSPVYELEGPDLLSSADVAAVFSELLGKPVEAQQIPEKKWGETLENLGFTIDATKNFIEMTELVIAGKAVFEGGDKVPVKLTTTLKDYLSAVI